MPLLFVLPGPKTRKSEFSRFQCNSDFPKPKPIGNTWPRGSGISENRKCFRFLELLPLAVFLPIGKFPIFRKTVLTSFCCCKVRFCSCAQPRKPRPLGQRLLQKQGRKARFWCLWLATSKLPASLQGWQASFWRPWLATATSKLLALICCRNGFVDCRNGFLVGAAVGPNWFR